MLTNGPAVRILSGASRPSPASPTRSKSGPRLESWSDGLPEYGTAVRHEDGESFRRRRLTYRYTAYRGPRPDGRWFGSPDRTLPDGGE
jgi:hypothetical protein